MVAEFCLVGPGIVQTTLEIDWKMIWNFNFFTFVIDQMSTRKGFKNLS